MRLKNESKRSFEGVGLQTPNDQQLGYDQSHLLLGMHSVPPKPDECRPMPSASVHLVLGPAVYLLHCSSGATPPLRRPTANNSEVAPAC